MYLKMKINTLDFGTFDIYDTIVNDDCALLQFLDTRVQIIQADFYYIERFNNSIKVVDKNTKHSYINIEIV